MAAEYTGPLSSAQRHIISTLQVVSIVPNITRDARHLGLGVLRDEAAVSERLARKLWHNAGNPEREEDFKDCFGFPIAIEGYMGARSGVIPRVPRLSPHRVLPIDVLAFPQLPRLPWPRSRSPLHGIGNTVGIPGPLNLVYQLHPPCTVAEIYRGFHQLYVDRREDGPHSRDLSSNLLYESYVSNYGTNSIDWKQKAREGNLQEVLPLLAQLLGPIETMRRRFDHEYLHLEPIVELEAFLDSMNVDDSLISDKWHEDADVAIGKSVNSCRATFSTRELRCYKRSYQTFMARYPPARIDAIFSKTTETVLDKSGKSYTFRKLRVLHPLQRRISTTFNLGYLKTVLVARVKVIRETCAAENRGKMSDKNLTWLTLLWLVILTWIDREGRGYVCRITNQPMTLNLPYHHSALAFAKKRHEQSMYAPASVGPDRGEDEFDMTLDDFESIYRHGNIKVITQVENRFEANFSDAEYDRCALRPILLHSQCVGLRPVGGWPQDLDLPPELRRVPEDQTDRDLRFVQRLGILRNRITRRSSEPEP